LEDNLDLVSDKKAPVVLPTQEYAGMSHPSLPIRSLLDPGTAYVQMVNWISDDPTRFHGVQEDVSKWREFFVKSKKNPVEMEVYNEDGRQKITWWKEFFSNGSGLCVVKGAVKSRK
jgi:hypothetical protein